MNKYIIIHTWTFFSGEIISKACNDIPYNTKVHADLIAKDRSINHNLSETKKITHSFEVYQLFIDDAELAVVDHHNFDVQETIQALKEYYEKHHSAILKSLSSPSISDSLQYIFIKS